ncbi:MAG: IPExxxVDY family protein, partial [Flavobacteriales bacterium]|nr:IPExxxVDY family protein [Flavobacteriales bacterium]
QGATLPGDLRRNAVLIFTIPRARHGGAIGARIGAWLPLGLLHGTRMARLKLELEPDPEVVVIGISCHEQDYRLCWALNRHLGLTLTRRRTGLHDAEDGTGLHAAYDHMAGPDHISHTVVDNHGTSGSLIREHREADYFLVVDREMAEADERLLERVRGTDFVLAAFLLDFGTLKAGHKLLG